MTPPALAAGSAPLPDRELALLSRHLGVLLGSGVPLLEALREIGESGASSGVQDVAQRIRREVEGGATLAGALQTHPRSFNRMFVHLVAAGEESGTLDLVMTRLAEWCDARIRTRRLLAGASLYPAVVLFFATALVLALLIWVVPLFSEMFSTLDVALPAPTRLLLALSGLVGRFWDVTCLAIATGFLLGPQTVRHRVVKSRLDRAVLRLPFFGKVTRRVLTARFSNTLTMLLQSGIPLQRALRTAGKTTGNSYFEVAIDSTASHVEQGGSLSVALRQSRLFSGLSLQLVAAGEKSGELDRMLARIAHYEEGAAETAISAFFKLLEPLAILCVGGIVGGIVVCLYAPVFGMLGALTRG